MSIYTFKQRHTIILAILLILGAFILYSLRMIAGALLSTVVLYTIFRPLYFFLTGRLKLNRTITAVLIMLSSLVIIVLPFLTLSLMVVNKISDFQKNPDAIKALIAKIETFIGSTLHIPYSLDDLISRLDELAAKMFPAILGGAADIFIGLLIMYFLLYFMFTEHEAFERALLKYAPFKKSDAVKFATELRDTTYSNVLGQGFIALVQGSLVSLSFAFFGLPDALFWGVISTFLSFLPVVGSPMVFIPAAIIQLANGNTTAGWGILLWGFIVIINIDNIIRFIIARKVANTHPIITVIGVVIGIPIFGILGLVFGPLLLSYFILTFKIYEGNGENIRLPRRNMVRNKKAAD